MPWPWTPANGGDKGSSDLDSAAFSRFEPDSNHYYLYNLQRGAIIELVFEKRGGWVQVMALTTPQQRFLVILYCLYRPDGQFHYINNQTGHVLVRLELAEAQQGKRGKRFRLTDKGRRVAQDLLEKTPMLLEHPCGVVHQKTAVEGLSR